MITGITGQDGAYLARLLLHKGYKVYGLVRPSSTPSKGRLEKLLGENINEINFCYGDLCDASVLNRLIGDIAPDEIYNLAAQSHVQVSFETPEYTGNVNALGALRLLEAVRNASLEKNCRFYQASTSELFGKAIETPQNETTPFHPRSPYGFAKLYAYWATRNYREAYGLHACNGILFNHESPLRGYQFVSQKIVKSIVDIQNGNLETLSLGNLDARRDWGHTKDYVRGMWLMLQQDEADDYVFASGENYSVRDFVEKTFAYFDREIFWQGKGLDEAGVCRNTGQCLIRVSKEHFRPAEVDTLLGDAAKAKEKLGWSPEITFDDLIEEMIKAALGTLSTYK
ncbi:MAG: GDP-mannose 4,6-dehydratase [Alphaproteobacteria bacterium]